MKGNHSATSIYGKGKLQRRLDAEQRQQLRERRGIEEQLELIRSRPGESKKEIARLEYKLWFIEESHQ